MRQHNAPRRLHFCLALLSVLSAMNPALSLATSHPEPIEEVTAMPLAPNYHLSRLDNGMQVILIKTDSSQPGASVRMRIAAGSLQEDAGYEPGLAHFLEHMAFNGSTHLRENEMVPFLEKHGISFGSHLNAETLFDETIYKLETPDTAESLDAALYFLREVASELSIEPSAVEKERPILQAEIRERQTPQLGALIHNMSFLAPACQLKEHIPLGTHTGIDQITPQRLKAYYSQYYTPANTRLIIAGNFNLDQLRRRIKTQFQTWNTHGKSETYHFPEPNPVKESVQAAAFIHPNIRSQISLALVQPFVRHSDTPARRKEQLLLAIANQTLLYRLQTRTETSDDGLRFPEVLTTNQNNCAITHQLSVQTPPGQWTAGLELLEKERRRALQHGFTSQEIQRQYDRLVNDAKRRVTAESQKTNQSYVDEALWVFNEQLTPTSAHDDLALLESLKPAVTVDHVAAVFQHYWSSPAPKILLSDAIGMKNIQQMLLDTYHVSTLQPLSQLAQAEQQAFYYQDFGPKAIPKQLQPTSYGNIHRYLFDNGVALSVKPTQLEPGMVHLSIRLGHGISGLSPAHAALIEVFNSGFLAGGLEQHSLEQLRHIFYGRTLGANLAFQDDAIQGTYLIANDDLLDQLKILAAYLTAPGYRESGMAFSRAVLENAYRTSQESPESVLAMNLDAVLHHQDPRWSFPDKKQLDAIKLADLKTIITLIRSHGPIEIGVVGDITPQQAIDRVGQTIGALNIDVVPPAISEQQTTLFFGGRQTRLFHQGDQQTALVSTIYPLPKANQQKASMTFPVLREVIQLKLTEMIRENEGLAYSPQAQSTQSRVFQNFNYLGLHSNTQVNKVDAVQTTYRRIIREIQNKGVTQDEFSRAISPIRAALEQRETHNDYWQDLTAIAFSYPEEVALAGQMDQQLQRIQPGDIQALAQQIKLSDAIELLILPQGTPQ